MIVDITVSKHFHELVKKNVIFPKSVCGRQEGYYAVITEEDAGK